MVDGQGKTWYNTACDFPSEAHALVWLSWQSSSLVMSRSPVVMNKKRLDVRRIHLGITPKADAKQKIEAALTDEIEMNLDEADKAAAADSVRYTEDEVFSRRDLRKQI